MLWCIASRRWKNMWPLPVRRFVAVEWPVVNLGKRVLSRFNAWHECLVQHRIVCFRSLITELFQCTSTEVTFSTLASRPSIWRNGPTVSPSSDGTHSGCLLQPWEHIGHGDVRQGHHQEYHPAHGRRGRTTTGVRVAARVGRSPLSCRTEGDAPRIIPLPVREARVRTLSKKGSSLDFAFQDSPTKPADAPIDAFLQVLEYNIVRWVPCEACPTFGQEAEACQAENCCLMVKWVA